MLKRLTFFFFLTLSLSSLFSQTLPHYWIAFTDKQHNTFSLSQPLQFLSQRALDRRQNQNVSLDSTDLPVSTFYLDSLQNLGLQITNVSKWLNGVTVVTDNTSLMDTIDNISFVAYHQQTKPLLYKLHSLDNRTGFQNISTTNYGFGTAQITLLRGNYLHQNGFRGDSMLIAVLDAGFYHVNQLNLFDSLREDNRIIATYDFVKDSDISYNGHTHGMSVLSTMAANDPGYFVGTAPKASYLLLRSEDASTEYLVEEDNWVSAAEYADSAGADLINTSLGYTTFDDSTQNYSYADMNGITSRIARGADMAFRKGILVVCSAGNSGDKPWHYISTPADALDVLTVGAVDLSGNYASFSSTGPTSDNRIKPNVDAPGANVMVAYPNDSVYAGSGTSFSSPITCGLVACLWQAFPDKTNYEIKESIEKSASQYNNPDSLLGYGIPDFEKAFFLLSGIDEQDLSDIRFLIYPNPVDDEITIDFFVSPVNDLQIGIYDLLGECVFYADMSVDNMQKSFRISGLEGLDAGIYMVRLSFNNQLYQRKIVKL